MSERPTVVLITAAPAVGDAVGRIAAAAGATTLIGDPADCVGLWRRPGFVLIDAASAADVARLDLGRRDNVLIVAVDDMPAPAWPAAVALGAEEVVRLPREEGWLVERLALADDPVPSAPIVAVLGGHGGAGATTTAIGLARAGRSAAGSVVLVDADRGAGGLDLRLGAADIDGVRWHELGQAAGPISGSALRSALPEFDGLRLLTFARGDVVEDPEVRTQRDVVRAAARGARLVVIDTPRAGRGAGVLLPLVDLAYVVTTATVTGAAATYRMVRDLAGTVPEVRLVVRATGPLDAEDIADVVGVPLAGVLPHVRQLEAVAGPQGSKVYDRIARACRPLVTGPRHLALSA